VGQPVTTTTTYVGQPTTTTYVGQPTTTSYVGVPTTQTYTSGQITTTQQGYNNRVVAEEIPVESRIEYIPFEKKYIEYDRVEKIERVPYEEEIVEYE
jgi:hypothetical protein